MATSLYTLGERQQSLLKILLTKGMTVDELTHALNISRNAVSQHLINLEGAGFIKNEVQPSTGGRPSKQYILTSIGKELFPRHYDLFANTLIHLLRNKIGEAGLNSYMVELGEGIARQYKARLEENDSLDGRMAGLVQIMVELGYEAHINSNTEIIANNCVFHQLAAECKTVCELDIALITSALNGVSVEHQECMVRGGSCCRFIITQ